MNQEGTEHKKNFWLVKFAPFRTNWAEIIMAGTFTLRGVRNSTSCKHLRSMRLGDPVFFYQSQQNQAIVGLMEVTREAYPDPTSADTHWLTCDFAPIQTLPRPVTLGMIREEPPLRNLGLIRSPRLAVMPVSPSEFDLIGSLT